MCRQCSYGPPGRLWLKVGRGHEDWDSRKWALETWDEERGTRGLGDVGLGDVGLRDVGLGVVRLRDVELGDVGLRDVDAGTRGRVETRKRLTSPSLTSLILISQILKSTSPTSPSLGSPILKSPNPTFPSLTSPSPTSQLLFSHSPPEGRKIYRFPQYGKEKNSNFGFKRYSVDKVL